MAAISQTTISSTFFSLKRLEFQLKFLWSLSLVVKLTIHQQYQLPVRHQAIIWTNDGLHYWRIYASLDLNELNTMLEEILSNFLWMAIMSNKFPPYRCYNSRWLIRALVAKGFCVSTCRLALNVMTCRYVLSLNKCNLCRCYSSCWWGNVCVNMSFICKCLDISTYVVVDKNTMADMILWFLAALQALMGFVIINLAIL